MISFNKSIIKKNQDSQVWKPIKRKQTANFNLSFLSLGAYTTK